MTIPFSVAELLVWTGGTLLSGRLEAHFANVLPAEAIEKLTAFEQ